MVEPRSAIVVPFELPPSLEAIRRRHVENASLGVPAHVTLLFPFVAARELGAADIDRAAGVIRRARAFDVAFREAKSFDAIDELDAADRAVWLAPEPAEPFVAMTNALAAAFPAYPPYGGIHDTVIPHLTLANVDVDVPALIDAAAASLPISRRVEAAALLEEDETGHWRISRELPLG